MVGVAPWISRGRGARRAISKRRCSQQPGKNHHGRHKAAQMFLDHAGNVVVGMPTHTAGGGAQDVGLAFRSAPASAALISARSSVVKCPPTARIKPTMA
jgi:hypothetical protein